MTKTHPAAAVVTLFLSIVALAAGLFPSSAHAQTGELGRLRERGEIVIATDATYPPFEFREDDKLQGFDIDLGNEIGKELGIPVRWVPMEWAGIFASLETGKADLVMSGVTITDERKKGNAFTRPYFLSGQVIARRKGDTSISGPDDLLQSNRIVAVQQDTTGQVAVEKRGLPRDQIHRFDTLQDALMDVRNNKSDAAVGDLPALQAMIRKGYAELEIVPGGPFVAENVGIVARKDALDLVAAINRALDKIIVDGRYARIYQEWIQEPVTTQLVGELARLSGEGTTIPAAVYAALDAKPGASASGEAEPAADAATGSALAIRWDLFADALPVLLRGARLTIQLTLLTMLIGIPLGLLIALARLSHFPPLSALATVYVEAVRGTPLLMQIYVIYFVLPAAGISLPSFLAGLAALSLNSAAYVAEIFRAGIESIDTGQREAARALGMSGGQAMRFVVLPQTLRRVLPPLTNEAVALLKDSSLVSVVALAELMRVGKEVATNTGAPTTVYLAVALLYLAMTLPLTFLVRRLEARWQPISRPRKPQQAVTATTAPAA